ncbi:hypothetical protein MNV49_005138 [Pseudohyphozyma bogoriensis]|nr:hypothetical protein MNV49_005138 [Pseudohyphozyma bogoriensis]
MTSIQSCPAEILHRILELATNGCSRRERYDFLLSTSLVAQNWTGPSQRLLWSNISISEGKLSVFVAGNSPARFPSPVVTINTQSPVEPESITMWLLYGNGPKPSDFVARFISHLRTVSSLTLDDRGDGLDLDPNVLTLPALAGLKSLTIENTHLRYVALENPITFQLTSLTLFLSPSAPAYEDILKSSAATLKILSYTYPSILSRPQPGETLGDHLVAHGLGSTIRLEVLALGDLDLLDALDTLASFPTDVRLDLKFVHSQRTLDDLPAKLERMLDLEPFEEVEIVRIYGMSPSTMGELVPPAAGAWDGVEEICEERGIVWEVNGKVGQDA